MMVSHTGVLAWAHPLVQEWFTNKFELVTEPQKLGWPAILAGNTTLISAPTGSGKTLAAFLVCIDKLVRLAIEGRLENQTHVIYISPLKALTNDVQINLLGPLKEIRELALASGINLPEIQVMVRTGDTSTRERQLMVKSPPHILVTTPESIYLLLTAEKSREILTKVETVIIDEIHALANSKRGTHLSLSLERLEALTLKTPLRIGLSATQKPIELVAQFLSGNNRPLPQIINVGHLRQLELNIEVPQQELTAVTSNQVWDEIYDRLAMLAGQNRSTLIFVNTRKLAERVAYHLSERLGENQVAAHHGSLSKKIRLSVENKLKNGHLRALVATASLELGIDIGSIDLVCLIGSTRSISIALQRIGRAGHWYGAVPKGIIFPTTIGELVECSALLHAIQQGILDHLIIPEAPLDILAQQIVASCAADDWPTDDLFSLVKNAFPYRSLTRPQFDSIIAMLAEGIAGTRGRYGAYLFHDKVNKIVKGRRGSRLVALTSGGAIPENGLFTVIVESSQQTVGTLDEDFAIESNRGDVILLGSTSWIVKRIESSKGRVIVEDAHGAPPSVPFWLGEAPARTYELSWQVSELRKQVQTLLNKPKLAKQWLIKNCFLSEYGAQQLLDYMQQGKAVLGVIPTQDTIVAERFFDESGGMQLILHTPFGARINKAWGLALRKRFCRSFNFELQAAATDDGINISLAEQHSFPLKDVFHFLHSKTIEAVLTQAVLQAPLFTTRWRWDAMRSLALVRFRNGKKVPPNILRMRADDLLAAVFPDAAACQDNLGGRDVELPEHPLILETMKDALMEALDLEGLCTILKKIEAGTLQCIAVDTPVPSVFSHEILNANPYAFLDDAPLEERRARAVEMRRILPESLQEIGKLDAEVIAAVQEQAWPDVRSADELHDMLQSLVAFPADVHLSAKQKPGVDWNIFFQTLLAESRAGIAKVNEHDFWLATENKSVFEMIYPQAQWQTQIVDLPQFDSIQERIQDQAVLNLLRGWLQILGPVRVDTLASLLKINEPEILQATLALEAEGSILRGEFLQPFDSKVIQWCDRRLLARIHQLTLSKLRKEIEPVTPNQFFHWLMRWQHLESGTQLRGEQGLLEVLKQLQGFEIPANAWEKEILPNRVHDYQKDMLDKLCFTGQIGWGRLSAHPSLLDKNAEEKHKRISPTSIVPITFFVREQSEWMPDKPILDQNSPVLSHAAQKIYQYLQEMGASFVTEIIDEVSLLKSEVEAGLWELVAAGLITADGFDNLRALIDARRRLRRGRRPSISMGRWSILRVKRKLDPAKQLEATCWLLLKRYGVCFRELLTREKMMPRWRELLMTFRRLEERGEIRGGKFISGFSGEQFALPQVIDSLRAIRKHSAAPSILISAVDPLNLQGIITPGEKIPAFSGKKANMELQQDL